MFSHQKEFLKKKVIGEIAFDLITLFHVQMQEPTRSSTTTRVFASRYIDFQTIHFADFEQFKVDIYFMNFGQVKIHPIRSFLLTLDSSQLFYWFG